MRGSKMGWRKSGREFGKGGREGQRGERIFFHFYI